MKILRQRQQAEVIGCSRWTIRRIAKTDPTYPQEIEISPGIRGVVEDDFIAWLKSRPLRTPERFEQAEAPAPLTRVLKAASVALKPPAKGAAK